MELPWTEGGQQATDPDAFVMGSRFQLKSLWHSPAFLMLAMRIWRQARRSPGLLGVSLRAYPLRGDFWTLSAWTDEAALQQFASTDPHRTIMKRARPWTKSATFRFWPAPAAAISPKDLWASAEQRITDGDPAQ